jgi:GNAT superfamily N-acetyltransferase
MSWRIEPLRPDDPAALDGVAQGMHDTLVEVEGEANAQALHDLSWLRDRALSHVDGRLSPSAAWLARAGAAIVGHCLVRREDDDAGPLGLFATTCVHPAHRRVGVAQQLHRTAEAWFDAQGLARRATWTAAGNRPLIALYERHGYAVDLRAVHPTTHSPMVRLSCVRRL